MTSKFPRKHKKCGGSSWQLTTEQQARYIHDKATGQNMVSDGYATYWVDPKKMIYALS